MYERNQCQRSVSDEPAPTWWIWAGVQRVTADGCAVNSEAGEFRRWGGHGEGLRRNRGDAAGTKLGISLVDRHIVNVGTIRGRPSGRVASPVGGRLVVGVRAAGWGAGPVVVRAEESSVLGEGGQQVSGEDAGMPGGHW